MAFSRIRSCSSTLRYAEATQRLTENAEKYGFVERYPADKEEITGIDYECWHFRYVGRDNAAEMNELGMCLEEYAVSYTHLDVYKRQVQRIKG